MALKEYMKELSPEQREVADQVVEMMEGEARDVICGMIHNIDSGLIEANSCSDDLYITGKRDALTNFMIDTGLIPVSG